MSWVSFAFALLKCVTGIMTWARQRELISEGYDKAIAEEAKAILQKTESGKKMMERVNAMPDADVDAGLRGLEPK
jgi:hypothetical protein